MLEGLVYHGNDGSAADVPELESAPDAVDGMGNVTLTLRHFLAMPADGIVQWLLSDKDKRRVARDAAVESWTQRVVTLVVPYLVQRYDDRVGTQAVPRHLRKARWRLVGCSRRKCGAIASLGGCRHRRDADVAGPRHASRGRGASVTGAPAGLVPACHRSRGVLTRLCIGSLSCRLRPAPLAAPCRLFF